MPLYFAYGSNMSPQQMAERCPGARVMGRGVLQDWKFLITTRGSANIIPLKGASVHGVIWRCNHVHMHHLDIYEGVNWRNYLQHRVLIRCSANREHHAIAYVSQRRYPSRPRPDYMLTAVLPGAKAFDLPEHYISELEGWLRPSMTIRPLHRYRGRGRTRK